jgi:hypothetical protein
MITTTTKNLLQRLLRLLLLYLVCLLRLGYHRHPHDHQPDRPLLSPLLLVAVQSFQPQRQQHYHRQWSSSYRRRTSDWTWRLYDSSSTDNAKLAESIAGTLRRDLQSAESNRARLSRDINIYNDQLRRAKKELDQLENISLQNQLELDSYERNIKNARARFLEFSAKSNEARKQLIDMEDEMRSTTDTLAPYQNGGGTDTTKGSLFSLDNKGLLLPGGLAVVAALAAIRTLLQKRPEVRQELSYYGDDDEEFRSRSAANFPRGRSSSSSNNNKNKRQQRTLVPFPPEQEAPVESTGRGGVSVGLVLSLFFFEGKKCLAISVSIHCCRHRRCFFSV